MNWNKKQLHEEEIWGAGWGKQPITPKREMKSLNILIIRSYILGKNQELKLLETVEFLNMLLSLYRH